MSQRFGFAVVCIAAALPCGACGSSRNYALPPAAPVENGIAAGDVFSVQVVGEEDLDGQYRVAQNGTVRFPYVGQVEVAGLEAPEVAGALAAALEEQGFLRDPQVRVFVEEAASRRVNVMGEVQSPGAFPITNGMTIVDAISAAGGFTSIARQSSVRVTRREQGNVLSYNVPVDDITNGEEPDFPLRAGDIVYVEQRPF